ncbi:hypothetical protein GBAR_LOCUS13762, partial [Geodia barretti]
LPSFSLPLSLSSSSFARIFSYFPLFFPPLSFLPLPLSLLLVYYFTLSHLSLPTSLPPFLPPSLPPYLCRSASAEVRRERSRLQREVESLKEQLATRVANEKPASSGGEVTKMRTLERTSRTLKSDKAQLQEEIAGLREELAGKDKDVREAKAAYRESQDEITRITDKLNDTRAHKVKYSRLAREKEEEIGGFLDCGVFNFLLLFYILRFSLLDVYLYVCMHACRGKGEQD